MILHAGDIIWADFYKDKRRPGAVVGNDAYEHITVLACPMTSDLVESSLRVRVAPGGSGLDTTSEIMPYRIQTLPHSRIKRVAGRLTAAQLRRLEDILVDILGLSDACDRLR